MLPATVQTCLGPLNRPGFAGGRQRFRWRTRLFPSQAGRLALGPRQHANGAPCRLSRGRARPRTPTAEAMFHSMIKPTTEQARVWAEHWRSAGPALARVRAELQAVDLWRVADELEEAFWVRFRQEPTSEASGLVAQQRLFARPRRP